MNFLQYADGTNSLEKISDIGYQCKSCIYCQASASLLSKLSINKSLEKIKEIKKNISIGHLKKTNIFVDNSLERFSDIFAAAGHPNCVFKIDFKNLLKVTQGEIKDIVE